MKRDEAKRLRGDSTRWSCIMCCCLLLFLLLLLLLLFPLLLLLSISQINASAGHRLALTFIIDNGQSFRSLLTQRQKLIYPNVLIAQLGTSVFSWFTIQQYKLEYFYYLYIFIISNIVPHMRLLTTAYVGQFVWLPTGLKEGERLHCNNNNNNNNNNSLAKHNNNNKPQPPLYHNIYAL